MLDLTWCGQYMAEKTASDLEKEKTQVFKPVVINRKESNRVMFRFARVADSDFMDDNTFQIALASEYPVQRRADEQDEALGIAKKGEKFLEVLSHERAHVNLTRLNDSAAWLDEHKDNRHLGKIQKAALSKDGVTRAVIQFDNASKLSKTRKKQVRSGSRPHVSMGYAWTEYLGEFELSDGRKAHKFAWEGLEGSSVAVPADHTVGKGRSQEECRCIRCGGLFDRSLLDADFTCEDCLDAEDPDDTESERSIGPKKYRTKTGSGTDVLVSYNDLRCAVISALQGDARFKVENDKGDVYSDFYVCDILQLIGADGKDDGWLALVTSPCWCPDSKLYTVDFEYDFKTVMLGDYREVEQKTTFEAVERNSGNPMTRTAVDSFKSVNAEPPRKENLSSKNFMAKTIAELEAEAPQLTAQIRTETEAKTRTAVKAELEPQIRTAVTDEFNRQSGEKISKLKTRNDEIAALANEAVKQHGDKWNGPQGQVYRVGERVRAFQIEALNAPENHDAAEVRKDFKRKLDGVLEGARAPLPQFEAANLEDELACRVSLKRMFEAATNARERSTCFMVPDGAEFEADKELRNKARNFPGGLGIPENGQLFPNNARAPLTEATRNDFSKRNIISGRRQRDALASDYPTAGALIAPEYMTPIELLRNKMALGRAGITVFSGVKGNLVFPRLAAPTTSQSVAEGAILVAYDQTFDQVKMDPHRIGSTQNYSRLALAQADSNLEAIIWDDHMQTNAIRADYLGINGAGANDEPLGLLNQVGIGVSVLSGSAANAYKNILALETSIRKSNIDEPPTFLTTSAARGQLRQTAAILAGATNVVGSPTMALWVGEELIGRPAVDTQQVPLDVLLALVGRHFMMASWAGMSVILDTLTLANQDKYRLTMNQYIDYALRHPSAVSRSADSAASLS